MTKPKISFLEKLFGGALDITPAYRFTPKPRPSLEETYEENNRKLQEAYETALSRLRRDVGEVVDSKGE